MVGRVKGRSALGKPWARQKQAMLRARGSWAYVKLGWTRVYVTDFCITNDLVYKNEISGFLLHLEAHCRMSTSLQQIKIHSPSYSSFRG